MKFGHTVHLLGYVASCKSRTFSNDDGTSRTKIVVEIGVGTHSKKFFVDEVPRFGDGSRLAEGDEVDVVYRENGAGYAEDVVYSRQTGGKGSAVPSSPTTSRAVTA